MSLDGSLEVDVRDDSVAFTFTVENTGSDPVTMQFTDGCEADVVVEDGGSEVWRWSAGRMFAQMMQEDTVDPGDTRTHAFEWEEPAPGDYEARASIAATNATCEATASFSV